MKIGVSRDKEDYLVAQVVARWVAFEQLRTLLFVHSTKNHRDAIGPHTSMLSVNLIHIRHALGKDLSTQNKD
jgi:uridine kinase